MMERERRALRRTALAPPMLPSAASRTRGATPERSGGRRVEDEATGPPARQIDWKAAIIAGLVAGAALAAVGMILNLAVLGGLDVQQIRMTAAVVLGDRVLSPEARFDTPILLAAVAVHFALSILFTAVLAALVLRLKVGAAELIGLVFGFLLYAVNFYVLVELFPWFREGRGWIAIVSHLVFGLVAVLEYKAFANRRKELGLGAGWDRRARG